MKKWIFVLVLTFAATSVFASNMGFKLSYNLRKVAGTTGTNWVSLPYFYSATTAKNVCNDIGANASQVGRKDSATDVNTTFPCIAGGPGFTLNEGEAIFVKVSTDNTPWVIVGSHDDSKQLTLRKVAGTTGTNWVSIPYHTTSTTAKGVCNDVGANASQVGRKDAATDVNTTFPCVAGGPGFSISVGEGVFIKVNTDSTAYTPSHY